MSVPKSLAAFKKEAKDYEDGHSSLMCSGKWLDCNFSRWADGFGPMEDHYTFNWGGKKVDEKTAMEIFQERTEKGRVR